MNDTLKAAGRIGAELGAAKAENERLRELIEDAGRELQAWVASFPRASHHQANALISRIGAALSKQAEPTDTYTAVDMATAAAQGFRDGQAATVKDCLTVQPMAYAVFAANGNVVCFSTRRDHPSLVALEADGHSVVSLAPIAQTVPQPEQSGWVSAAERVPAENDGEVLVLMADGTCEIAWASYWLGARTDFAGWTFRDPDEDRTPTHWMPLPALSAQGQSNGDS